MTQGKLFDGQTADQHLVDVEPGPDGLRVGGELVPADELLVTDEDRIWLVLGRTGRPGWRLSLDQPVDPAVREMLPRAARYGGWIDRFGLVRASVVLALVTGVVIAAGYMAPAWIAPLVPERWERNLGQSIVGDYGSNACRTADAQQAIGEMIRRLEPDDRVRARITPTILDIDIFNAAALPGAQIVVFKGALKDSDNPDAMAGILAHEMAHVRRRHVMQALIRDLGIGALIRLFAGDVGTGAEQLMSLSYTRSNESEADADAIRMLKRAGIDPRPTAALFRKLDKEDGNLDAVTFLNSHPRSAERAKLFDASYDPKAHYRPVISARAYAAMRTACPEGKDNEFFDLIP